MAADGARTWILTRSPAHDAAPGAHGFTQGRLRTVLDADVAVLTERVYAAAGVPT